MAVRHLVLFKFRPDTDPAAIQALADGLRALPAQIPEIVDYHVGPDIGLADSNWDFGVSADFDGVDDFHTYRGHPAHVDVVDKLVEPITESRIAVQFDR